MGICEDFCHKNEVSQAKSPGSCFFRDHSLDHQVNGLSLILGLALVGFDHGGAP